MIVHVHHNRGMIGNNHSSWLSKFTEYIPFGFVVVGFLGCLMIEFCEIPLSTEFRNQIYSIIGSVGFYFSILLNTVFGRQYNIGWLKSLLFSFLSFQFIFSYLSVAWTNLDIYIFDVGTIASYRSIIFLPLLGMIFARFCELDTMTLCDFLTPYFFFNHGFVTLACWIEGCCAGRPWSWGLLNPLSGIIVFPTQPCIIILSIVVAYWGLWYSKENTYKANGLVFANSLCFYGAGRYLIELFSDDERIFWMLSWFSVCSLVMIGQGFLTRHIIRNKFKTS